MMINKFNALKKKIKDEIYKLAHSNTSEHDIALGFAVGTFISLTIPVVGFLVGLIIAFFYKRVNKLALLGSIVLWNPFFLIPMYIVSYGIGNLFFGPLPGLDYQEKILPQVFKHVKAYLVGNFLLAIILSVFIYFLVKYLVGRYRKRKAKELVKK